MLVYCYCLCILGTIFRDVNALQNFPVLRKKVIDDCGRWIEEIEDFSKNERKHVRIAPKSDHESLQEEGICCSDPDVKDVNRILVKKPDISSCPQEDQMSNNCLGKPQKKGIF